MDTSGAVALRHHNADSDQAFVSTLWSDLDAFTQGYLGELFADLHRLGIEAHREFEYRDNRFSDLSPDALAMILADCAARLNQCPSEGRFPFMRRQPEEARWINQNGGRFWRCRQEGKRKNFPPLTVSLGDDGKVRLATGDQ